MEMCSNCHKRVAVVFISKMDSAQHQTTEGLCLSCAKKMGIKPVNDILDKLGIPEDAFETMEAAAEEVIPSDSEEEKPSDAQTATPIDLGKIFSVFGNPSKPTADKKSDAEETNEGNDEDSDNPFSNFGRTLFLGGNSHKEEPKHGNNKSKYLTTYCRNLNEKAEKGQIDSIVGRERELNRVIQILSRRQKNNPCLIGEPGVGKTAIAEALAERIVNGNVPPCLKLKVVFLLDLTSLVAGTQFRGQFESRVQGLLSEIKARGDVILVIDEVHTIVGAGDSEGSMSAANMLKPALSRGEIQVIGATTLTEYRKTIEKDSALERRFQPVIVDEPSIADAENIILGIKHYYEEFHHVVIPDEVAKRAVSLSERYITDRYLPDKAIDLIDEAAAHVAITSPVVRHYFDVVEQVSKVRDERVRLEQENSNDTADNDRFRQLAELKTQELNLSNQLIEASDAAKKLEITVSDLADVIEIWTSVPASTITESEFVRLDRLESRLKSHIVGQDEAVSAVVRAIKRNRAGVASKRKPVSFIFAGPTGVGKTELVKTIAADLFSSPDALIRIDMSEYMEQHAVSKIIGSPPGYVGYDEAGQLTEKIRRHPYSVVLFDEIEKAHPDVMNILLQILDDGRISDSHGKVVNFENTIIVMTTNAGSSTGTGYAGFNQSGTVQADNKTEKALSDFLRPEFINRVDEIVTFRSLDEKDFVEIARIMTKELENALSEKGIRFIISENALTWIAGKAFSRKYGARNLRRFIQTQLEDKIAEAVISHYETPIIGISVDTDESGLHFDFV